MDVGTWGAAGQRRPERRARDVTRDRQRPRVKALAALDFDAGPVADRRRAERLERMFGMVARRRRLDHPRAPGRMESRQQHAALDLGARHLRLVCNPVQRRRRRWSAAGGRRRPSIRRSHPRQRLDDPPHRPTLKRRVTGEDRAERMRCQQSRTAAASWCPN